MRSNGFAPASPGDLPARRGAWLLAVALHLLAGWALTRPEADADDDARPPMTLVYVDLPPPLPPPLSAPAPDRAAAATRRGRPALRPAQEATAPAGSDPALAAQAPGATPIGAQPVAGPPVVASDDWSMPATPRRDDGIRFERRSPMASINPIRRPPPERFRMRQRAASLGDYVRALSQVLLWPAGYTDDPCDGLAEAAQVLAGQATTKGRQALLEDVVRQQKQYCGP